MVRVFGLDEAHVAQLRPVSCVFFNGERGLLPRGLFLCLPGMEAFKERCMVFVETTSGGSRNGGHGAGRHSARMKDVGRLAIDDGRERKRA